jgi:predicted dehydrogenase
MGIVPARIGAAVVGYGYWGPNLVRNLISRREFEFHGLCELSESCSAQFLDRHPGYPVSADFDAVLDDPRVQAVLIATPPLTHFDLVSRALEAGKHVLVEKPLARSTAEAVELVAMSEQLGLVLMPGHTFLYSPAVNKVRELIREDVVGETYFITSSRMNLGKYQRDGVICDLAPHDLSILLYWLDEPVVEVSATGRCVFDAEVPETAFLTLSFASGTAANIQVSWLAPRKLRQMVIVGSKRMVQYEDTSADEAIRVYDRGLDFKTPADFGEYRLTYRTGDMVAPRIEASEPLGLELADFAEAILTGTEPRSSARLGLEIVKAVEASEASLRAGGRPVAIPAVNPTSEQAARRQPQPLRSSANPG